MGIANGWYKHHALFVWILMELKLLRAFLAVARRGSFTEAARELGKSQPTLSRQVRDLEASLGVPLFERLGKSVHLTEPGRHLAAEAARLLGDVERTQETVRAMGGAHRGRLRIGAGTTPGLFFVPSVIARMLAAHSEIEPHFTISNTGEVGRALLANELDVGFVGAKREHAALDHRPLFRDEISCVAAPGHPLAGRSVDVGELLAHTQVVRERGSATRAHVEANLARLGLKRARWMQVGGPEAVKAMVRAGIGVAWISGLAVAGELQREELVRVRVPDIMPSRTVYLVIHLDKRLTPILRELLSAVEAELPASQTSEFRQDQRQGRAG